MCDVKVCPLLSSYKFKDQCRVTTCKFYSTQTGSRCLGLDIKFSSDDKVFSDGELLHYKFPDQELSIKEVGKIRKKAIDRVKNLLILKRVIDQLADKQEEFADFQYEQGKSTLVDNLLLNTGLSLPVLGFEIWMLPVLFDEDWIKENVGTRFKLREALMLSNKEFAELERTVKILSSGETLFDSVI